MPSGDYLVSITVGGKTMKRVLRVETIGNVGGAMTAAGEEEEEQEADDPAIPTLSEP